MDHEPVVFIVDDDPAARESVAVLVRSKGMTTETFPSAEDFLAHFKPQQVGCLVVDVRMTGMSGIELQETLSARGISIPVVVVTGFGDVPTAVRAMGAGAFTFLEKPCRGQELWSSIQKALDMAVTRRLEESRLAEIKTRLAQLTVEQRRVLQLLMSGKTNKAIAGELNMGLRTAELRRSQLMKKMQVDNLAGLVRLVLLAGDQIESHHGPVKPPRASETSTGR